jgi:hypothetical protein
MSLATYEKDPDAILDYEIDWSDWLAGADGTGELTIADSVWAVAAGLTTVSESNTDTAALIRLSGGIWGSEYRATNHIVASNGEEDDRTIVIRVVQR